MEMQMEMDAQNLESLRQIIHGLIKLSYDQENLMKEFNSIQQSDPKYLNISQGELNLQNDSKVLEDSLLAMSKKDPFLGNIVTREVGELNDHVNKAVDHIKERRKGNGNARGWILGDWILVVALRRMLDIRCWRISDD